jgi:hypothetical protein
MKYNFDNLSKDIEALIEDNCKKEYLYGRGRILVEKAR